MIQPDKEANRKGFKQEISRAGIASSRELGYLDLVGPRNDSKAPDSKAVETDIGIGVDGQDR